MAKRILIAQGLLIAAALIALLARETPGLIREIRMWRMASPQPRSSTRKKKSE